jgi:hypothetical protein
MEKLVDAIVRPVFRSVVAAATAREACGYWWFQLAVSSGNMNSLRPSPTNVLPVNADAPESAEKRERERERANV